MIYALIDKESLIKRGLSLKEFSQKLERLNIPIAQYRNKSAPLHLQKEDLSLIRKHYSGKLIINDKIELIDQADGLHLGQGDIRHFSEDLPSAIHKIREKIGNKLLGLSTHTQEEIDQANKLDLDYIGLGAYRGTSTKLDARVLGEKAIALAKLSRHPVGLIGGVKQSDRFAEEINYRVIGSDLYED